MGKGGVKFRLLAHYVWDENCERMDLQWLLSLLGLFISACRLLLLNASCCLGFETCWMLLSCQACIRFACRSHRDCLKLPYDDKRKSCLCTLYFGTDRATTELIVMSACLPELWAVAVWWHVPKSPWPFSRQNYTCVMSRLLMRVYICILHAYMLRYRDDSHFTALEPLRCIRRAHRTSVNKFVCRRVYCHHSNLSIDFRHYQFQTCGTDAFTLVGVNSDHNAFVELENFHHVSCSPTSLSCAQTDLRSSVFIVCARFVTESLWNSTVCPMQQA